MGIVAAHPFAPDKGCLRRCVPVRCAGDIAELAPNPVAHGHDLGPAIQMAELAVDKGLEQMAFDIAAGQQVRQRQRRQVAGQRRTERRKVEDHAIDLDRCRVPRGKTANTRRPGSLADRVFSVHRAQPLGRRSRQSCGHNALVGHGRHLDLQQDIGRVVGRRQRVIEQDIDGEAHRRAGFRGLRAPPIVGTDRYRIETPWQFTVARQVPYPPPYARRAALSCQPDE